MLSLSLIDLAQRSGTADSEAFALLDRAAQLGCILWDIGEGGAGATLLARYFSARPDARDIVFISAQSGHPSKHILQHPSDPYDHIMTACNTSLRQLAIESIDLYLITVPLPVSQASIDNILRAITDLKGEGKVRHVGLQDVCSDTLRRINSVHPVHVVSVDYNPFSVPDSHFSRTCKELGVVLIGRHRQMSKHGGKDHDGRVAMIERTLEAVARRHEGTTAIQIGLAWLLSQAEDIVPMPRTKTIQDLEAHVRAARILLSVPELRELGNAIRMPSVRTIQFREESHSSPTSITSQPQTPAQGGQTHGHRRCSSGSSTSSGETLVDVLVPQADKVKARRQANGIWAHIRSILEVRHAPNQKASGFLHSTHIATHRTAIE
ncbi:NADP-dependent oxidoreductase domain-containing protein [Auriculariales sp. MPI-PUGE-AT-0066]|nr:NADP-dependent oxidoreductase domain-containing protein [Auriculariales sp. MPI-PUGE-AT-0066]